MTIEEKQIDTIEQFTASLSYYVIGIAHPNEAVSSYNSHCSINNNSNGNGNTPSSSTSSSSSKQSMNSHSRSAASLIAERKSKGVYGAPAGQAHAISPSTQFLASVMDQHLHRNDMDTVGGAIVSVPALDLRSPFDTKTNGTAAVLPSVGKSSNKQSSSLGNNHNSNGQQLPTPIPAMVASVLRDGGDDDEPMKFYSNQSAAKSKSIPTSATPTPTATNPSLNNSLTGNSSTTNSSSDNILSSSHVKINGKSIAIPLSIPSSTKSPEDLLQEAALKATDIECSATKNLGRPISYTRSSAPHAPGAMARTLFDSFSSLVESRVKAWTLLLLRHSLSSGDEDSRSQLMALLATNSIDLSAMVTSFNVDRTKVEKLDKHNGKEETNSSGNSNGAGTGNGGDKYSKENCDFTLPLSLDVDIDLKLQGKIINLHLEASGTVAAAFHQDTNQLTYFQCQINTNSLVSDMIAQARLVVLKAVAQAASSSATQLSNKGNSQSSTERSLSQFGSSLSLSNRSSIVTPTQVQNSNEGSNIGLRSNGARSNSTMHVPMPVRNSLVTNSSTNHILGRSGIHLSTMQGGDGGARKRERERSVTWDRSVNDLSRVHSIAKRPKRMNSLKRSIQSFGKPNNEFFQSSKNATFAEFGHLTQNSNVPRLGTNGRVEVPKTHHMSTMNLSARHTLSRTSGGGKNVNASFDLSRTMPTSSASSFLPQPASSSLSSGRRPTFNELSRNAMYSHAAPRPQNSLLSLQNLQNLGKKNGLKRTPTQLETQMQDLLHNKMNKTSKPSGGNAGWN